MSPYFRTARPYWNVHLGPGLYQWADGEDDDDDDGAPLPEARTQVAQAPLPPINGVHGTDGTVGE